MSIATDDSQPRIEKLTSGQPLAQPLWKRIAEFDRGVEALDRFLHRYASQNQKKDSAQNWLALIGGRVVGYYTKLNLVDDRLAPSPCKGRAGVG